MIKRSPMILNEASVIYGGITYNRNYTFYSNSTCIIKIRHCSTPDSAVIKLFSYSTRLSTNFILLINVKMPTRVGILTFIGKIYTTYERLKARHLFIFRYFSFYEQVKFRSQLSMKKVLTAGPGHGLKQRCPKVKTP